MTTKLKNFQLQITKQNIVARFATKKDWFKDFTQYELDTLTHKQIEDRIEWHDDPIIGFVSGYTEYAGKDLLCIDPVFISDIISGMLPINRCLEAEDGFLRIVILDQLQD